MKREYTDKEVREKLKNMCMVVDTREQVNQHITDYFDQYKIAYESKGLGTGDYSFKTGDMYCHDEIVIERTASLDEIAGNFTVDRKRFENEFLRAKAQGIKVFLLIENAAWNDIESHNYISKLNPKSLLGSLLSWQARYNITINFCRPEETGKLIYGICYYWLKNKLENG